MERSYLDSREYQVKRELPDGPRRNLSPMKTMYDREVPKIYKDQNVDGLLKELDETVKEFDAICQRAMFPVNLGFRRSACCCCFKSLFHEVKQMGIVLRRAFKGTHVWIPPLKQQQQDVERLVVGQSTRMGADLLQRALEDSRQLRKSMGISDPHQKHSVKIDAMFFTTTEEHMILLGDEDKMQTNPNLDNDFHPIDANSTKDAASSLVKNERRYLDMDTVILCNPNAMCY